MHWLRIFPATILPIVLVGCGTPNTPSPIHMVPNTNQLSLSNVSTITIHEFHYGNKSKPVESISTTGKATSEIIQEINQSQIVSVASGTPLVAPMVGPQTVIYSVIVNFKDGVSLDTFDVGPPWAGTVDKNNQSNLDPGISTKLLSQLLNNKSGH